MLVRLAGAGDPTGVIECQSLEFGHAAPQCLEILQIQPVLLLLKVTSDNQQMMVEHVEFIQQAQVGSGDIGDEQVFFVGQEGIEVLSASGLAGCAFLASSLRASVARMRKIK